MNGKYAVGIPTVPVPGVAHSRCGRISRGPGRDRGGFGSGLTPAPAPGLLIGLSGRMG